MWHQLAFETMAKHTAEFVQKILETQDMLHRIYPKSIYIHL